MNVLHLLVKGEAGGIESLCRDYANYSNNKNVFAFLKGVDSVNAVKMKKSGHTVIELNYSSPKAILLKILSESLVIKYLIQQCYWKEQNGIKLKKCQQK